MDKLIACDTCDQVQRLEAVPEGATAKCARCGFTLFKRKPNSLHRTAALSLAALVFYVPANIYPILRMEYFGAYSESTIWEGCVALFEDGQYPVAVVVFLASIVFPLLKLLGLFFLVLTARSMAYPKDRSRVLRFIEWIGPWAMLDVFLMAILVALVKLGQLFTVLPGPGLLAFAAVVVFTILATSSFDSRLIWDRAEEAKESHA